MFVIKLTGKGTGVTLSCNDVVDDDHVHFWEFAFGTANVLFNEFIQNFQHFGIGKLAIDDVVSIVLAAGFLESGLRGFLEPEKLQDILWIGSEMFGNVDKVDDVGFDTVSFGFDFELHFGHTVTILGILHG